MRGPIIRVAWVDRTSMEMPVGVSFSGKPSPSILLRNEKSTLQSIPLKQEINIRPETSVE